ncbi:MAG: alpha/beta hydrolase [Gemmataceae bacterium]
MLGFLRKLQYGARVFLASRHGEPQTIDVAGYPTQVMHGGKGDPFVYLHSTLGESVRWLPFHQAFANQYEVLAPTHPGFNDSPDHSGIDTIEDLAFHYVQLFDALGWDQVISAASVSADGSRPSSRCVGPSGSRSCGLPTLPA